MRALLTATIMLGLGLLTGASFGQEATTRKRRAELVLVVGAPGTTEYEASFRAQAEIWRQACAKAEITLSEIGNNDRAAEELKARLRQASTVTQGQLWLVFVGHGSYDGREAKFNLRGPDLTPTQLAEWCQSLKQELVMLHGGSSSAGFLPAMAGKDRIIVTGTKSADEVYYARFGEFFAQAIAGDLAADLDQDRQVTVLEAFRYGSRTVTEFYEKAERIATEHSLLEDDGDGTGTRAEIFSTHPTQAKDGRRAGQIALVLSEDEKRLSELARKQRDKLELQLDDLKAKRSQMTETPYYEALEKLLRELSTLYTNP